jgi:hypothetical protein
MSPTFPGESAEYRAARDRLIELRRDTVYPTSRAMSLAAPHPAQETTR